jgi:hypothetical protein
MTKGLKCKDRLSHMFDYFQTYDKKKEALLNQLYQEWMHSLQ